MSVRKVTTELHIGGYWSKLQIRKPSKPFREGDILEVRMPDNTIKRLFVGQPTEDTCINCSLVNWDMCLRTKYGKCIKGYTENYNAIIDEDVLEDALEGL